VAQCVSCRAFAEDMGLFERQVGRAARSDAIPEGVSTRLLARLVHDEDREALAGPSGAAQLAAATTPAPVRTERRWRWSRRALSAAVLAMAVGLVWLRASAVPGPVARVARAHGELLIAPGLESDDAGVVTAWVRSQSGLAVHVPLFPDARLVGAAIVQLQGERVAVLRYQVGAQFLAYAVMPRPASSMPEMAVPPHIRNASHRGVRLVSWTDAEAQHVWMGTLSSVQLRSFATRCIAQARVSRERALRTSPLPVFAMSAR
jgi:hypothetical protein